MFSHPRLKSLYTVLLAWRHCRYCGEGKGCQTRWMCLSRKKEKIPVSPHLLSFKVSGFLHSTVFETSLLYVLHYPITCIFTDKHLTQHTTCDLKVTYKHKIFKVTIKMSICISTSYKSREYLYSFLCYKLWIVILL